MNKKLQSALLFLLAFAMLFSLAACGKQEVKPEETPAPEYVYQASYQAMDGDVQSMSPRIYTDEGFYATAYMKIGENKPEGAVAEYEGQFDVYGYKLYFVSNDGTARELSDYEPLPVMENTEDYMDFGSGSDLNGLLLDNDGRLVAIENRYANWFDGPESARYDEDSWEYYQYQNEYWIRVLDDNGKELSSAPIQFDAENTYLNFYNAQIDEQGNILASGDMMIAAFAPDGTLAYQFQTENNVDGLYKLRDGRIAAPTWGDNGMTMYVVDTQKKALGEELKIPGDAYNPIPGDEDYDIYYTSGMYLYGYNFDAEEPVKLLNWIDCDVNGERLQGVHVNADGTITGVLSNWNGEVVKSELITVKKVPANTVPEKKVLTLAVIYSDYSLTDQVIAFNRSSDTTRISILDYSEYNDIENEDYDAGRTKLTTEIMAGNMPDILALNQLPYTQLAAKGLLEDLYPYLDKDPELNRSDYFENVLHAMEVDGKLCQLSPTFQITSLIGAASVVGDKPGWTYADFEAALASMPEGCEPMDFYVDRNTVLQTLMYLNMDEYVDWSTGKCSFESQSFYDLLNFCTRFPASFDWENYDYDSSESTETRIKEGRQMLMQAGIYSFDDIQYNDVYFGGDATYIGYPTSSGESSGSILYLGSGYAMSAKCQDKDAAWEFLRTFLTADYQKNQWGLPTNVKVYQDKLKEAMTPTYRKDGEGNFLLDENGEKIMESRGGWTTEDGETHYFYALTQEQADKLWDVITSVDAAMDQNQSIYDIVNEQAQAFFSGQKSVEEVARLIQSKANIYVNEQM